jgi:hypothetical protein
MHSCTPCPAQTNVSSIVLHGWTVATSSRLMLTWSNPIPTNGCGCDAAGIIVQRTSNTNATWSTIANISGTLSNYQDCGLTPGSNYFYRLYAYNAAGNSPNSNVAGPASPTRACQ